MSFRAHAEMYHSSLLDGTPIEAVESYLIPKQHQIEVGISLYPFDPYSTGIALDFGYLQNITQSLSWQIIDADLFSSFQSGLTSQLAQNYSVNPTTIEHLSYIISTNLNYYFFYGKFIFFKKAIRYIRGSLLFGGGLLGTSLKNQGAGNFGTAFEVLINDTFSFKFTLRDSLAIPSFTNYVTFALETGVNF